MHLDGLLERNRRYVRERQAQALPPPQAVRLIVLACIDPRLDHLLESALGLEPGRGMLFRTPGAYVAAESATLRSLMTTVLLFGSTELVAVGHTSCRMAAFETSAFVDAFRERGVPRDAFGPGDLREWAGAIASPRRGVELTVHHIVTAPFRPRNLTVSGAVLDDTTGALEVVVHPSDAETLVPPEVE